MWLVVSLVWLEHDQPRGGGAVTVTVQWRCTQAWLTNADALWSDKSRARLVGHNRVGCQAQAQEQHRADNHCLRLNTTPIPRDILVAPSSFPDCAVFSPGSSAGARCNGAPQYPSFCYATDTRLYRRLPLPRPFRSAPNRAKWTHVLLFSNQSNSFHELRQRERIACNSR